MNRSAVSPGRPRYPRASPAPATYSSPATPGGTSPSRSSSTYIRMFQMGRPIGGETAASLSSGTIYVVAYTVASAGP